jgi:hypothetical protein
MSISSLARDSKPLHIGSAVTSPCHPISRGIGSQVATAPSVASTRFVACVRGSRSHESRMRRCRGNVRELYQDSVRPSGCKCSCTGRKACVWENRPSSRRVISKCGRPDGDSDAFRSHGIVRAAGHRMSLSRAGGGCPFASCPSTSTAPLYADSQQEVASRPRGRSAFLVSFVPRSHHTDNQRRRCV